MSVERVRLEKPARERLPPRKIERERLAPPQPERRKKAKANRAKLTEEMVDALPSKRTAYMVWDKVTPGLHVHVQAGTATKAYRFSYRFPGAPQALSYKLGRWPGLTLDEARAKARAAAQAVEQGRDPRTTDPKRSGSFWSLAEEWCETGPLTDDEHGQPEKVIALDKHRKPVMVMVGGELRPKLKRKRDASLQLVKYHTKAWEHRPAGAIAYAEVESLLAVLRDEGKRATAMRLFSHLATLFRWAAQTKRLPSNPIADMGRPCTVESRKDKVARGELQWLKAPQSETVLRGLWALANDLGGDEEKFIKLLILTGKRRNAVQGMCWERIEPGTWFWTPPQGSKSKRNNPVTLPKLAQRVLGPHKGSDAVLRVSEANAVSLQATVRKELELPDFIWHGVRHIVTTGLARLKVAPHISRLAVDHAAAKGEDDVHAGYEHVDWTAEVAEALERWSQHVSALVAPGEGVAVLR